MGILSKIIYSCLIVYSSYAFKNTRYNIVRHEKICNSRSYMSPPSTYSKVEKDCLNSINKFLKSEPQTKRLSVDVLTPGLNPKLEQKAILLQEYLFALVYEISLILSIQFSSIKLCFPSIGDAASYQKYIRLNFLETLPNVVYTDVGLDRFTYEDDCAIFITTKNNIGDPVIRTVQSICETYPAMTSIFLNCDLRDKVTSGMQEKRIRDAFRNSIRSAYYFRNLVTISRPSMTPYELGCLRYSLDTGWEIYALNEADVIAMGSLNRYMKTGSFRRSNINDDNNMADNMYGGGLTSGNSPTTKNVKTNTKIYSNSVGPNTLTPPRFILAKRFSPETLPNGIPDRDEIDRVLTNALARAEKDRDTKKKVLEDLMRNLNDGVSEELVSIARKVVYNLATTGNPAGNSNSLNIDANIMLVLFRKLITGSVNSDDFSAVTLNRNENNLNINTNSNSVLSQSDFNNMNRISSYEDSNTIKNSNKPSTVTNQQQSQKNKIFNDGTVWENILSISCLHPNFKSVTDFLFGTPESCDIFNTENLNSNDKFNTSDNRDVDEDSLIECFDIDEAEYTSSSASNPLIKNMLKVSSVTSQSSELSGELCKSQLLNLGFKQVEVSSSRYRFNSIVNIPSDTKNDDYTSRITNLKLSALSSGSSSSKEANQVSSESRMDIVWLDTLTDNKNKIRQQPIQILLTHENSEGDKSSQNKNNPFVSNTTITVLPVIHTYTLWKEISGRY